MSTPSERNHVESLIGRASAIAIDALDAATRYGLHDVATEISWAIDDLRQAARLLAAYVPAPPR